jgi:hypothetical protein
MNHRLLLLLTMAVATTARSEITVLIDHNSTDDAAPGFHFAHLSSPGTTNLATDARIRIVDGKGDSNSGGTDALQAGYPPDDADQPDRNFFFEAGSSGGSIQVDLRKVIPICQVNTYSWHSGSRAPQVYKLYAATGTDDGFKARPAKGIDPASVGWKFITSVDTRTKYDDKGGQYGVGVSDTSGKLGEYRYLLFVCSPTETSDTFGNTFYSEIDVLDHPDTGPTTNNIAAGSLEKPYVVHTPDGKYQITIDFARAPDLKDWAETNLAPILVEWYPKIVALLPSDGYTAPLKFKVNIRPGRGVADTSNTRINAYTPWIKKEMHGESVGALVHEMVHVVQQYGDARRNNPDAKRNPGWLVEGLADYVRWYLYEPQSHGADVKTNKIDTARYNDAYRPTANFLHFVTEKYDKDLVPQVNALMRQGNYDDSFWTNHTGKSVQDLSVEWKAHLKETGGK